MAAIRRMTPSDIPAVAEILAASHEAAQWDLRLFADPQRSEMAIWVAEEEGVTVGMIAARAAGGEAEILNLAVAPVARRHGIGRQLVRKALEMARLAQAERVFLEVRESNAVARAFYAGLRFVEVGRRRGYYHDPTEDAQVLSRALRVDENPHP